MVPPDATIGADVAHLEAVRVLERWQFVGHLPDGGFIAGGGCTHIEPLVRPLAVELLAQALTLELLSTPSAGGRAGGFRLHGAMPACMAAILLGCAGLEAFGEDPQAERWESRPRVLVAQGTPWSVRRRWGNPNALNRRVNPGLASATRVEVRA
jgi:hypothetical protein